MSFKFRTLVNRHQNQVFSLAYYILRDRGEAEDVTQESYLKLWQNIKKIDLNRARPWLLKITRNACIDRLRTRQRESAKIDSNNTISGEDTDTETDQPLFSDYTTNDRADDSLSPTRIVANDQLSHWLRKAIQSLKEPDRTLIFSRDIQQKSYEDIAIELSMNLSQVKVYLHRARRQLRNILRDIEL